MLPADPKQVRQIAARAITDQAGGERAMAMFMEATYGGRTHAELATQMGISRPAVTQQIARTRAVLQRYNLLPSEPE